MTIAFTEADIRALKNASVNPGEARVREIAGEAAAIAGTTLSRVVGPDANAFMVRTRDAICYMANREGISCSQIGRVLSRDRSTVLASIRREKARRGEISA